MYKIKVYLKLGREGREVRERKEWWRGVLSIEDRYLNFNLVFTDQREAASYPGTVAREKTGSAGHRAQTRSDAWERGKARGI